MKRSRGKPPKYPWRSMEIGTEFTLDQCNNPLAQVARARLTFPDREWSTRVIYRQETVKRTLVKRIR